MHDTLLQLTKPLLFRCLSPPDNLDLISADRSVEHTTCAIEFLNQAELSSLYGIIKPLVVS